MLFQFTPASDSHHSSSLAPFFRLFPCCLPPFSVGEAALCAQCVPSLFPLLSFLSSALFVSQQQHFTAISVAIHSSASWRDCAKPRATKEAKAGPKQWR
jgi:hypothetical protein